MAPIWSLYKATSKKKCPFNGKLTYCRNCDVGINGRGLWQPLQLNQWLNLWHHKWQVNSIVIITLHSIQVGITTQSIIARQSSVTSQYLLFRIYSEKYSRFQFLFKISYFLFKRIYSLNLCPIWNFTIIYIINES